MQFLYGNWAALCKLCRRTCVYKATWVFKQSTFFCGHNNYSAIIFATLLWVKLMHLNIINSRLVWNNVVLISGLRTTGNNNYASNFDMCFLFLYTVQVVWFYSDKVVKYQSYSACNITCVQYSRSHKVKPLYFASALKTQLPLSISNFTHRRPHKFSINHDRPHIVLCTADE